MKFSKVRKTDYRPQSVKSGLDKWDETEAQMAREHDLAVFGYDTNTARAALADLSKRCSMAKDPQWRWIRHRKAALARKLHAPELCQRL